VAELHALDPFAGRTVTEPEVWWCDHDDAAIVLGSRQTEAVLDHDACARAGLEIVHRRSGGGAVLLAPGAVVWIDAIVPHGVAPDDVRGSMVWIGDRWRIAIAPFVAAADLVVHAGGMMCTPWSDLVCFAGIGPGEVLVDDAKLVGLSQRRTRHGLRLQGLVHRRSLLAEMPALFAVGVPPARPDEPATAPAVDARTLSERLADLLASA
jgi:lipoate-protein ligase A